MLEASSNFRKMTLNNEQWRHFLAVDQWYSKPTNIETSGVIKKTLKEIHSKQEIPEYVVVNLTLSQRK